MSNWNSMFISFNKSLLNDEIFYSIKDYIKQFKAKFNNEVDIGMMDDYYMSSADYDKFIVSEESISETINIKKIIKKYDFQLGVDYILVQKPKTFSNVISPFKSNNSIKMTPLCFKKILILSGNNIYINYFIFLETVMQSYEEYQKMFNRKTLLEAQKKIKLLERKIQKKNINKCITGNSVNFNEDDFSFFSDSS
jgi:hypothetical protein